MTFGSNELIYVAGSNLPIMIEQLEEEEYEKEFETPTVPPRAPKVARTRTPEPKISFSYTHDPRVTPTRKTSTLSHASLTVQYNEIGYTQETALDASPPKTLPRKRAKKKEESLEYTNKNQIEEKPLVTPRMRSKKGNGYESIKESSYSTLTEQKSDISNDFGIYFTTQTPETLPRRSKLLKQSGDSNSVENVERSQIAQLQQRDSITSESTEATQTTIITRMTADQDTDIGSSATLDDYGFQPLTPPPRRYATIPRKKAKARVSPKNIRAVSLAARN